MPSENNRFLQFHHFLLLANQGNTIPSAKQFTINLPIRVPFYETFFFPIAKYARGCYTLRHANNLEISPCNREPVEGFHSVGGRDRNQPSASPSVSSIGTFRKCLSRVKRRPPHSIVAAAIQMSFVGMGVPFLLSKLNIMQ